MSEVFVMPPAPDSLNDTMSPEELHVTRNAPNLVPPGFRFPPYQFRPFPTCVYRRKDDSNEVESRLARNQAELDDALDLGWAQSPAEDELKAAGLRRITKMAKLEEHRAYEDRNMSPAAQAEVDREQENREDFLVEMPAGKIEKRGPGRPRKDQT